MSDLLVPAPPDNLDLDIPSIPQITLELIQLLNDDTTSSRDITSTIKLDPVLTARIISYVNSPLMAPSRPITDLDSAIIRCGRNELKKIFYRTVIRDAFASFNPETENILHLIWMHSLTASLAMDKLRVALHGHIYLTDSEQGFLSTIGILHNIGFSVLHHNYPDQFSTLFIHNPPSSMDVFLDNERVIFDGLDHCLAGKYLLDKWYFPSFIGDTLARYLSHDIDLDDHMVVLLRLSNYLALQTSFFIYPDNPPDFWISALPEFWDMSVILNVLPELAQDVAMHQGVLEQN